MNFTSYIVTKSRYLDGPKLRLLYISMHKIIIFRKSNQFTVIVVSPVKVNLNA